MHGGGMRLWRNELGFRSIGGLDALPPSVRETGRPLLVASAVGWLLLILLTWPMALHPLSSTMEGLYHDGHVWCFQYMGGSFFGGGSERPMIGYPFDVDLQFIGWGAALLVAPLQWILGPVGAYNASFFVSSTLNIVGIGLLLRILGASPWPAAAGALLLAFCPFALEALSNGQVAKFQIWVLALHLLVVWAIMRGWWRLPLIVPASLLLAYTSPTLAMSLPMVLVIMVAWFGLSSPRPKQSLLLGVAAIVITGICLVGASTAYDLASQQSGLVGTLQDFVSTLMGLGGADGASQAAFFPASVTPGDYQAIIDAPEDSWRRSWKVARIDTIFLGGEDIYSDHVPYFGLLGFLVCGYLSRTRFEGRFIGWLLVAGGVLLALGPQLASSEGFVYLAGNPVPMPARLLDAMGYPVGNSGMYHRFLVLGSLGLAILLACGMSTRKEDGNRLSWIFALLIVADGVFQSSGRWPRPSNPVEGIVAYEAMAEDPMPGAVISVPLRTNDTGAGSQIMLASFHGRSTSGLLRFDSWNQNSTLELRQWFAEANRSRDPADYLAAKGVRYVLWTPWVQYESGGPDLRYLSQMFGAPMEDGKLRYWKLDEDSVESRRRTEQAAW